MNRLFFFLFIFIVAAQWSFAQQSDSTGIKTSGKQTVQKKSVDPKVKKMQQKLKGFIDKNSNGIDDRLENRSIKGQKKRGKYKDRFIDLDGDGICDGRESAIGLQRRHRMRGGKAKGR